MFRPQSISSTDARKYFTKIINKVSFSSKSFVIQTYRQPIVRLVNENYIRALEEVLGKKTVNQVMQIAGNDQLFEAEKIEQIKKVFQRRLSGAQRPEQSSRAESRGQSRGAGQSTSRQGTPQQPRPQPQRKQDKNVVAKPASPPVSKPQQTKPQPKPQSPGQKQKPQPPQKSNNPNPQTSNPQPPTSDRNREVLLLSNGKNYQ